MGGGVDNRVTMLLTIIIYNFFWGGGGKSIFNTNGHKKGEPFAKRCDL